MQASRAAVLAADGTNLLHHTYSTVAAFRRLVAHQSNSDLLHTRRSGCSWVGLGCIDQTEAAVYCSWGCIALHHDLEELSPPNQCRRRVVDRHDVCDER
jgi:hypothetical protein